MLDSDRELVRWLAELFRHYAMCDQFPCPLCDSALAIREQMGQRLFGTVKYPEHTLLSKKGKQ